MGDYTIDELNEYFFNILFKQYEAKGETWSHIVNPDHDRFSTMTFDGYQYWDEYQILSFEKLLHLVKINEKVKAEGYEGLTTLKKEYQYSLRNLIGIKIKRKSNNTGILFFSCCPKKRIDVNEGEVRKLREFLQKFVAEQYFFKIAFCIESGKHKDKPNLHFHILGHYNKNGSKNFRSRVLNLAWNKYYPDNPLEWNQGNRVGINVKKCNCDFIVRDKLKYFHNESKGSHMNYIDLGEYYEFGDWSQYR